jgi:hypothetical protein
MNKPLNRKLAAGIMASAVIAFLSLAEQPLGARRCQEECDAMLSSCQFECQYDTAGACAGEFEQDCVSNCQMSCQAAYTSCSTNAMMCGTSPTGVCDAFWLQGWEMGQNWYDVWDQYEEFDEPFWMYCTHYN